MSYTYLVTEAEFLSAAVTPEGDLTFTRNNGQTINAGNVVGWLRPEDMLILNQAVQAAQAARDETIVAVTDLGDITGAVTLSQEQAQSTFLKARLTGDVTLTLDPGVPDVAYSCSFRLAQDAVGGRTLTLVNVATAYGVPIALSPDPNRVDVIRLESVDGIWTAYLGAANISVPIEWTV